MVSAMQAGGAGVLIVVVDGAEGFLRQPDLSDTRQAVCERESGMGRSWLALDEERAGSWEWCLRLALRSGDGEHPISGG